MPRYNRAKALLERIAQRPVHYNQNSNELLEFGWKILASSAPDFESSTYKVTWGNMLLQTTIISRSGSIETRLNDQNLEYFLQKSSIC